MSTVRVLPARAADVAYVGKHLRDEDREELEVATGRDPVATLLSSHRMSAESYAVFIVGAPEPVAVFGVVDAPASHKGIIWMLCTPEAPKHAKSILREARVWLTHLSSKYNGLQCLAWSSNYLHVRWCKILGFVELSTRNLNGQDFVHLYRPKNV